MQTESRMASSRGPPPPKAVGHHRHTRKMVLKKNVLCITNYGIKNVLCIKNYGIELTDIELYAIELFDI